MTLITIINLILALCIVFHCVNVLSQMNKKTNHLIRAMYWFFALGAFAILFAPVFGYVANAIGQLFINIAVVLFCVIDRRRIKVKSGYKQNDTSFA